MIKPVVVERTVRAPIETCFRVYVDEIDSWWRTEEDLVIIKTGLEAEPGGRLYDVDEHGNERQLGTVLAIERPARVLLRWHLQTDWSVVVDPERHTELEITFAAIDDESTVVRLEHRGFERLGPGAAEMRETMNSPHAWAQGVANYCAAVEA